MRQTQIFAGSSHPALVESICNRLGQSPAKAELGKFANGETKVNIQTSIRDQNVFIVQSGSSTINDAVMELLIMISACKSGSAKSITAVMPYFPYSRQSKKKSHRGSITARMIANLLDVAGVNHVIAIDLHASQMQGFFHCPVDNLVAEPLLAHWIKMNIKEWKEAVVVSKNPGGTKRVTSLADALKLSFGIVMTDRYRPGSGRNSMSTSLIMDPKNAFLMNNADGMTASTTLEPPDTGPDGKEPDHPNGSANGNANGTVNHKEQAPPPQSAARVRAHTASRPSPLGRYNSYSTQNDPPNYSLSRVQTSSSNSTTQTSATAQRDSDDEGDGEDDSCARDVVTGRLIHGHIVDDDVPSPSAASTVSASAFSHAPGIDAEPLPDAMLSSVASMTSNASAQLYRSTHSVQRGDGSGGGGLGGSGDAGNSSDDEDDNLKNPELESTVTLVGNVRGRPVFLLDDMMDKSTSWIAAAETVVKRGGATAVYCFATHGLFGSGCLQEIEACEYIDAVVVTDAFPIPSEKRAGSSKLQVLDVSALLAEAIRRNHHGESIHQLFLHYD